MMQLHKKLNEDWFIGIDERDELWVCAHEDGDKIFAIPVSMKIGKGGFSVGIIGPALIDVAILISLDRDDWFERGKRAGREQTQREVQELFGMNRIAVALEEMAARS